MTCVSLVFVKTSEEHQFPECSSAFTPNMCSLDEDDLVTLPQVEISSQPFSEYCKKCNGHGSIILRKKDIYCVSCFTNSVNHKFRARLGKNKVIRVHQKVAIAASGGLASSVLLNFVHNGLSEDAHKKLCVDAVCIYIDENLSEADYRNSCSFMLKKCKEYSLPLYISHIGNILIEDTTVLAPNMIPELAPNLIQKYIKIIQMPNPTSVIDFRTKLRRNLLLHLADQLQCSLILSGEISTRLASTMLTNLTLGRGAQIQDDIGFCDNRGSIRVLKPIKDLTYEDVKMYAHLKNISYLPNVPVCSQSIQFAIEKFVTDLQENYPATISTVCKTGEKMGDNSIRTPDIDGKCVLCKSLLDTEDVKCSALAATELSRRVSSPADQGAAAPACAGCSCSNGPLARTAVEKALCYGCRLILRDVKDENVLRYFVDIVNRKSALCDMEKQIKDFLL